MLLPRPEIRTATRLGSCIVGGGPVLRRIPGPGVAANGAAAWAAFDPADLKHVFFSGALQLTRDGAGRIRRDDHGHTDAAVERARHLFGRDPAAQLEELENCRKF